VFRIGICVVVLALSGALGTALQIGGDKRGVLAGNSQLVLLNDELATKEDRKTPGAVVLKPEQIIVITRMAAELEPVPSMTTFVFDGQKAHTILIRSYDAKEKMFVYWDSTGNRSFLEEDNNRAGVKAKLRPGKERAFVVSAPDMQKVLQAVLVPWSCARHYYRSADLDTTLAEYKQLREKYPKSDEIKEPRMLKCGRLLAEAGEDGRAVNIYSAVVLLHKDSSRALAGIAAVYAKTDKLESAVNFYADAIKGLPADGSLVEMQRKDLAAEWEKARQAVQAKRDSKK
jgi:tetratricopeptide (TPR) repeat protein